MAFEATFNITQSSSGLTAEITDESTYGEDGIEMTDFSDRMVTILDAYGEPFTTVTFEGEKLTATFDVRAINLWADATMNWTGINPVADYEKHLEFPLGRITENNYQNVLRLGCCSDAVADNALTIADRYLRGSLIAASAGNSAAWSSDEDSALKYLRSVYSYRRVPTGSN